jgi:hypothetical protein
MRQRLGAFNFTPDISFTEEMSRAAYVIVIHEALEIGHGIPNVPELARALYNSVVYTSYVDAKKALMDTIGKFESFIPVAYGDAYPYENTTFEKEITENDYACAGWVVVEEDESKVRVPIGLHKVFIQDNQQAS